MRKKYGRDGEGIGWRWEGNRVEMGMEQSRDGEGTGLRRGKNRADWQSIARLLVSTSAVVSDSVLRP